MFARSLDELQDFVEFDMVEGFKSVMFTFVVSWVKYFYVGAIVP